MSNILTNKRDNMTVKGTVASSEPFVLYQVKQLVSNVIP